MELLLLNKHVEFAAESLDNLLFDKGLLDVLDRPTFTIVLNAINKKASPLVPDEFKPELHAALDDVIDKKYGEAAGHAIEVVSDVIEQIEKLNPNAKEIILSLLLIIKAALIEVLPKPEDGFDGVGSEVAVD